MIDRQLLIQLYKEHQSGNVVAGLLGVSKQRVEQLLKRLDDPEVKRIRSNKHQATSELTNCSVCKRKFGGSCHWMSSGICETCRNYAQLHKKGRYTANQRHLLRPPACVHCKRPWTEVRHASKGYCMGCYTTQVRSKKPGFLIEQQRYRERHKDKILAKNRKYYHANKEKVFAYQRIYKKKIHLHLLEYSRQYYIRRLLEE